MKTIAELSTPHSSILKIQATLDGIETGLLATTKELAELTKIPHASIQNRHAHHPALAAYRFARGGGKPLLWGNKETIKQLSEATFQ